MDDSVYPVVVRVVRRHGKLFASVDYPDGEPIFVNCKCKPTHCDKTLIFDACSRFAWSPCRNLDLRHCCGPLRGIRLVRGPHGRQISLPPCSNYTAKINLELINPCGKPVIIRLLQTQPCGKKILEKTYEEHGRNIVIQDCIALIKQESGESLLSLRLLSKNPLEIRKAKVEIK
jgi:hypothetical protein